jgi:streptomycin 6-kinase
MAALEVPDLVHIRAMSRGRAGQRWLDSVPDALDSLAQRWDLRLVRSLTGGTAGVVVAAIDSSGRACALKVAMVLDDDDLEAYGRSVLVHQLADGRGCAELFDHDPETAAMLLEHLGPNLDALGMSVTDMLDTITTTLRRFWMPAPMDCNLPTGADQARWLADHIVAWWDQLGRPCAREVVDRALAYCDERATAFDPSTAVLVHGDAHGWNTLRAAESTFKFVDPEGLRSEPAHDLAVPLREYNEPLLAGDTKRLVRERAELLAARCDVDPEPVWQWGFVERVSTGLAGIRELDGDDGRQFLEVAARCL